MLPENKLFENFNRGFLSNLNEMNNRRIDDETDENNEYDDNFDEEYRDLKEKMEEILGMTNKLNENSEFTDYEDNNQTVSYLYNIDNILTKDLKKYLETHPLPKKFHICPYQINNTGFKPFLQIFLRKHHETHETDADKLTFITFDGLETFNSIVNKCFKILEVVFLSYMKVSYYKYNGFLEKDNEIYLFYDCTNSNVGTHRLERNCDLWLVLMDEIVNSGKVCEFQIDSIVSDLFLQNTELLYLTDSNKNKYELPVAAYTGKQDNEINFVTVFGAGKTTNDFEALVGPYYYFTDYDNALNMFVDEYKKKNGVIRFALFMGNMKVPLNSPNDMPDLSDKTQNLLLKDITTTTKEYKTVRSLLKVSDRDGKWVEDYDSVYIGKIQIDDELENKYGPYWVIKLYEQQTPLTYHIIKNKISTSENNNSKIL